METNVKAGSTENKAKKSRFSSQLWFIWLCLLPVIVLVLTFTYYPVVRGITLAFQDYNLMHVKNVKFIGFDNFKTIFHDNQFILALKNSLKWVFYSLIAQFILGFILALVLNKPFKGRGIYQGLVFYSWALSGFLIGLIFKWLYNSQIGVINDLLLRAGIIKTRIGFLSDPHWAMFSVISANVWYGIAFFAIMLLAALQSIPGELFEAADIDGAGWLRKLFNVIIPYIMPTIITTTLLRVIWIFSDPTLIYSMTNGGPAGLTNIVSSFMLSKVFGNGEYGLGSAVGIVMMIMLMLYTIFYLFATKSEKAGDF